MAGDPSSCSATSSRWRARVRSAAASSINPNVGGRSTSPATSGASRTEIGHLAGLDGLRGLAVTAVVVFHLWPQWLPAGFLGVSVFFTLSGYLITRLLLAEHEAGTASLGRFWARRVRRLAPASVATLVGVAVVWWSAGWWDATVRGDVLAGVAQVANWRQIATGDRYGVDEGASPLLHLWSLAVEEQVYVVVPLLVMAARTARRAAWVFALMLVVAAGATAVHAGDATVTYYGTHVRMGEVAAGALAAALVHGTRWARPLRGRRSQIAVGGVVAAATTALLAAMVFTSLSTTAYSRGGLLLVAVASTMVVVGVVACAPLGRVVDVAPLRYVGQHSYGIYLVHWPVLVALRRTDLPTGVVPWVTVGLTLVLAAVSLRWWETPVRERRWGRVPVRVGVPVTATLVVAALALPAGSDVVVDVDEAQRRLDQLASPTSVAAPVTASPTTAPDQPTTTAAPTPRRVRWGILGDSKALALALGLASADDPRVDLGALVTGLGCPLGRGGRVRDGVGSAPYEPPPDCDWSQRLDSAVAERGSVDVMLVYFGSWDVRQRQVPALADDWSTFPDPAYEQWLADEADLLHRLVLDGVATTVQWLTVPADPAFGHDDRFAAYNDFARRRAQHPSGCVGVIDLAGWLATDERAAWALPDGIHTTWDPDGGTSRLIGEAFLLDAMVDAVTRAEAAGC